MTTVDSFKDGKKRKRSTSKPDTEAALEHRRGEKRRRIATTALVESMMLLVGGSLEGKG